MGGYSSTKINLPLRWPLDMKSARQTMQRCKVYTHLTRKLNIGPSDILMIIFDDIYYTEAVCKMSDCAALVYTCCTLNETAQKKLSVYRTSSAKSHYSQNLCDNLDHRRMWNYPITWACIVHHKSDFPIFALKLNLGSFKRLPDNSVQCARLYV